MPRKACTKCGAASLAGTSRCVLHPYEPSSNQLREYRGSAEYRQTLADVLERDNYLCHICSEYGADSMDHHPVPHSKLPRNAAGQVPRAIALDKNNLCAAHKLCNSKKGNR